MRILGQIPHPKFRIVAYSLDQHYYVEIEAGPMKQCYKLKKEQVSGLADIEKWLDEEFQSQTYRLFEDMYRNYQESVNRNFSASS